MKKINGVFFSVAFFLSACGGGGGGNGDSNSVDPVTVKDPADWFVISGNNNGTLSLMLVDAVAGFARAIAYEDISAFAVKDMYFDESNSRLIAVTSNDLHTFSVNTATGEFVLIDSGDTSGSSGSSESSHMILNPDASRAYVASGSSSGFIDIFNFNADGFFGSPASVPVSVDPDYLAMNPAADKLYLVSRVDNQIQVFDINSDGSLGSSPGTMSPGNNPTSLKVHSSGNVAYVTRSDSSSTLQVHVIDSDSGLLAPSASAFFDVGSTPIDMVMDSTGSNLYVLESDNAEVHHFMIDASGSLSFVGFTELDFSSPTDLSLSDTGTQLYVGHQQDDVVSTLNVNTADGSLSTVESARVFDGSTSVVAIGGLGVLQPTATFLFSTDRTGLSRFSIDANGTLELKDKDTAAASLFGGQVDVDYNAGLLFGAGENDASDDFISSYTFDPASGTTTFADTKELSSAPNTSDFDALLVGRSGGVVYILDEGADLLDGGTVITYTYNEATGELIGMTDTDNAGNGPENMTLHPAGHYLYVVNSFADTISRFLVSKTDGTINNNGTTTPGNLGSGVGRPIDLRFHPNGRIVYVSLEDDQEIKTFLMQTNGSLSEQGTVIVPMESGSRFDPGPIGVHPSGKFVYVGEQISGGSALNSITLYSVNANDYTLTYQSRISTDGDPGWIEMDPQGQFLVVRERNGSQPSLIEVFTINQTTGALTNTGQMPSSGGSGSSLYPSITLVAPLQVQ
jgi:6-phosphogluconolactonase (cycloisomerase 2 family)